MSVKGNKPDNKEVQQRYVQMYTQIFNYFQIMFDFKSNN
jgi:hypothetical protein